MNRLARSIAARVLSLPPRVRLPLQALAIAGCATLAATILWSVRGHLLTHVDYLLYDRWAQAAHQSESPVTGASASDTASQHETLLIVPDDTALPIPWDRRALARTITALSDGHAASIGLAESLTAAAEPEQGGAAGDALLAEAMSDSARVVVTQSFYVHDPLASVSPTVPSQVADSAHPSWPERSLPASLRLRWNRPLEAALLMPLLRSVHDNAAVVGQEIGAPDVDGTWRRLPLMVVVQDRLVPAFGLALHAVAQRLDVNETARLVDRMSAGQDWVRMLVPGLQSDALALQRVTLSALLQAVHQNDHEQVRSWAEGRTVLLPPTAQGREGAAPSHYDDAMLRQLQLLATLRAPSARVHEVGTAASMIAAWLLASVAIWCLMRWRNLRGVIGVALIVVASVGLAWLSLASMQVLFPLALPALAIGLACSGTVLWNHFQADAWRVELEAQIRRVQGELAAVRDALVCQESSVEQLEEDLEAARTREAQAASREAAQHQSTAVTQAELERAREQESATRARLAALETELTTLRGAEQRQDPLPEREWDALREEAERLGLFTRDRRLLQAVRDIRRSGASTLPVLILGESGTGKDLFARAVHRLSAREARPFIAVNMAAISHELFESELFGHLRGSFSGATQDRPGLFELADRGTLFLDEIGDLRPDHQAKLLRALQDKTFYRVGATKPTHVDVRIVAATNKDLLRGIAEGWFREDLYARLKGILVTLPPLRERLDDLPALVQRFLERAAQQVKRQPPRLTQDAMAALSAYPWPRNVRELEQCLEQAVALSDGPLLNVADLRLPSPDTQLAGAGVQAQHAPQSVDASGDAAVLACLRTHRFDMQATARALDWDRSTVTQRLKGLCFQTLVETGGDRAQAAALLAQDPTLIRTVELKLVEYADHLTSVLSGYRSSPEAIAACRKRFKNLPDRHFKAVETLIRQHFAQTPGVSPASPSRLADRSSS